MAFLIVPSTLLTQLQAVNLLISTLGESPVTTLDPSPSSDVDDAIARLNEVDLDVQSRGWHWNREYALPLALAADGTVPLPSETLRVTQAYSQGIACDITARGTKLYDLANHTSIFTVAPKVDIVLRLDWDSLPQVARSYITYSAAQQFQARKMGSQAVLQVNAGDVARSLLALEQHEDETAKSNSVNGNTSVISTLYGIGGMRRNRGGY